MSRLSLRYLPAGMLALVALLAGLALAVDPWTNELRRGRDQAATSALHDIAMLQAEHGNALEAKHTVAQITEPEVLGPARVTVVCFCEGRALYADVPPPRRATDGMPYFLYPARSPDHVPHAVPPGLPADYLAVDARHGARSTSAMSTDAARHAHYGAASMPTVTW